MSMHVKCMSMFLYDELTFQGVTHSCNSCITNKNFNSCPNLKMKISQMIVIVSPVRLEFKMIQEWLVFMQNNV